jgi:hypothetical protein
MPPGLLKIEKRRRKEQFEGLKEENLERVQRCDLRGYPIG